MIDASKGADGFARNGARPTTIAKRFYELTKTGRGQLIAETDQWRRLATAIGRILGPNEA
jgi:hypothetical protein